MMNNPTNAWSNLAYALKYQTEDEHECDSHAEMDDDICRDCLEHAGFCSECGLSDCCGARSL
jgi:hypothetical protein